MDRRTLLASVAQAFLGVTAAALHVRLDTDARPAPERYKAAAVFGKPSRIFITIKRDSNSVVTIVKRK